jgi:hypothetical protein
MKEDIHHDDLDLIDIPYELVQWLFDYQLIDQQVIKLKDELFTTFSPLR